jgi:hypothetical protein
MGLSSSGSSMKSNGLRWALTSSMGRGSSGLMTLMSRLELLEDASGQVHGHGVAQCAGLAFALQGACIADAEPEPVLEVEVFDLEQHVFQVLTGCSPVGVRVFCPADLSSYSCDQRKSAFECPYVRCRVAQSGQQPVECGFLA